MSAWDDFYEDLNNSVAENIANGGKKGSAWGSLKRTIKGAGPVLGGMVGTAFGGPAGAKIGAGIGGALSKSQSASDAEDAAQDAAGTQEDAYGQGIAEQRRQFDVTQENMAPWLEAGTGALGAQQDFLGLNGAESQQSAYDNYSESPGQKFLRDRGEKATMRHYAGIGGLGGGGVRSALNRQGIGWAAQDFGNHYNRLAGMSGTGQSTASTLGGLGANTASNISQGYGLQGNARASGILGGQQASARNREQMLGLGTSLYKAWGSDDLTQETADSIASYDFT